MTARPRSADRRPAPTREKPELIADELRRLIIAGALGEGDSLGREPDLIERFGVSRPSLREALRILEAEGLITVVRGVHGGVVVHRPDRRQAARAAAIVLQTRNVSLADVFEARRIIEPAAVRLVAQARTRRSSARRLRTLVDDELDVFDDALAFGQASARFHEELVQMAGNQTLGILAEVLDEVVVRAITVVSGAGDAGSDASRRRGVRSQRRLADLIEAGDVDGAEQHWRAHLSAIGRAVLGHHSAAVIDMVDHL